MRRPYRERIICSSARMMPSKMNPTTSTAGMSQAMANRDSNEFPNRPPTDDDRDRRQAEIRAVRKFIAAGREPEDAVNE